MNQYDEWLEEYKHLEGQHNQKKHGFRGGTAVGREAISGLGSDAQGYYNNLSEGDKVKFRLGWYREMKKSGNSTRFMAMFEKKRVDAGGTPITFSPATTPVQPKTAVPATPVNATAPATPAAAPAAPKSTVFEFGNTKVDVSQFQTKATKLAGVNDHYTSSSPNRTVLSYDIKKTNRKQIKAIEDIRDAALEWRNKNNLITAYATPIKQTGKITTRNGDLARMYSFSLWDTGRGERAQFTNVHGPNDREIVFEFWMPL